MQQCMKLSLTNSPIGLIALIDQCSSARLSRAMMQRRVLNKKQAKACQLLITLPLNDLVVMAGRPHPFPFRTRP